jgi:voltage-gated potassium channel
LKISEIDMSRQSFIILIVRGGKMLIPDGELVVKAGDKMILYTTESKEKYIEEPSF